MSRRCLEKKQNNSDRGNNARGKMIRDKKNRLTSSVLVTQHGEPDTR